MDSKSHFDEISEAYDREIPEHIRLHLLEKKTRVMRDRLKRHGKVSGQGLDCGCGTGHYLAEMAKSGFDMSGFEYSSGMLEQALKNTAHLNSELKLGSITEIPFPDASFDFCYTINVLHHLPSKGDQITAVREMLRVTKPGGIVFLQDFDADNPLVRLYMNVIFPITSSIDDDETEIWVSTQEFRCIPFESGRYLAVERFTLLPNFTPRIGFSFAKALETGLERVLGQSFGAHFNLVFERV